ncbi:MAG: phosphatidylserine synthase [Sulfurimonas sp. RIFOXYD12_FULL_33_39]|uniref:CDP-alcohol phosphatidyltransferase family protein n=1 Tax=unclassified Sulfurimonas TaxID=2623549 RepID=UPI0008B509BA|nr:MULTISPECIES: CDP-alcohol phosphatidyltransferase family protein [unclassified Sulfurimonas]OHE07791.1 MAG: phosphatidylserine synthase [Sulfurimonas sp. RIFCSPLOWO2_12_FULL_34_6]OHE09645.1 MAG: phosphatidylserine synthase [Sulfurimonas sp. RIFOXYD12_FULL_33_39]OHE13847.1 MAG: phosphatidylserine synthase [Sulfurimonas sp. RIFOXYD2_FULL_34_21]DAB27677.1 MAG TPA: phosphatidylserine synthase [Sulfurimonas sp. UBA10385]
MKFLFTNQSHFNLANMFTFVNITAGLTATYFITQNNFFAAIILAWIGGAFDIFDGKIARKYKLSNEFGVQLDSFADFLSFVLVPVFLVFQAVYDQNLSGSTLLLAAIISIYYVISGLRRLIQFNINSDVGEVKKYFTGVPTPLGAILLWLVYLAYTYTILPVFGVVVLMIIIGWSLNSKIRVPHL